MDEGFAGQVGHARGHLATVAQEGVVINTHISFLRLFVKEVFPEVSFAQQFQH